MKNKLVIGVLVAIIALITIRYFQTNQVSYQGYVEGEAIYLASPYSGNLKTMYVQRGQQVIQGETLFQLDMNPQEFAVEVAKAQLDSSRHTYQDLQNPKRVQEIDAIKAQIGQTNAQLLLAQIRVNRYQKLYVKQATDKDHLDESLAIYSQLQQQKVQLQENLELALLGSRDEQIKAQYAVVNASKASVLQVKWQLAQKTIIAPASGVIYNTYYRTGEFVGAEKPIASLLTPDNIRVEFFVPAQALAHMHLDQEIYFTCDGCDKNNQATINYISPVAEYMPPLVYSRDNKDKIVFRIMATIKNSQLYKPGQPVLITRFNHD